MTIFKTIRHAVVTLCLSSSFVYAMENTNLLENPNLITVFGKAGLYKATDGYLEDNLYKNIIQELSEFAPFAQNQALEIYQDFIKVDPKFIFSFSGEKHRKTLLETMDTLEQFESTPFYQEALRLITLDCDKRLINEIAKHSKKLSPQRLDFAFHLIKQSQWMCKKELVKTIAFFDSGQFDKPHNAETLLSFFSKIGGEKKYNFNSSGNKYVDLHWAMELQCVNPKILRDPQFIQCARIVYEAISPFDGLSDSIMANLFDTMLSSAHPLKTVKLLNIIFKEKGNLSTIRKDIDGYKVYGFSAFLKQLLKLSKSHLNYFSEFFSQTRWSYQNSFDSFEGIISLYGRTNLEKMDQLVRILNKMPKTKIWRSWGIFGELPKLQKKYNLTQLDIEFIEQLYPKSKN